MGKDFKKRLIKPFHGMNYNASNYIYYKPVILKYVWKSLGLCAAGKNTGL